MPATISKIQIADPDVREIIRRILEAETVHLNSDCKISIIDDQKNDAWEIRIDFAGLPRNSQMLYGSSGEHQPDAFKSKLREMLKQ